MSVKRVVGVLGAFSGLFLGFLFPGSAMGATVPWPPELFTQVPSAVAGKSSAGPAAGQLDSGGGGVAVNSATGHIYVADDGNDRVDEFTAWGEFVKAWGWGVRSGASELQTCTTSTGCQKGLSGAGPGEISGPTGIAVDSDGNVYVSEELTHRVEKFDPEGHFLLMFGGEVNKTKVAEAGSTEAERNLCTVPSGNECGVGTLGSGDGQFGEHEWAEVYGSGTYLAIGPTDAIYVGDVERIEKFDTAGAYTGSIKFSEAPGLPAGSVKDLAVDPFGNLYLDFDQNLTLEHAKIPNVYKLDASTGKVAGTLAVEFPEALASDSAGSVYVVSNPFGFGSPEIEPRVLAFSASEACKGGCEGEEVERDGTELYGLATSGGCGLSADQLIVSHNGEREGGPGGRESFLRVLGPIPDPAACPPPVVAPQITDQFTVTAGSDGARVEAKINPHFWPDTTYYVEYGTGKCSEAGCAARVLFPGAALGKGVGFALASAEVALADLSANTTYHYRFVAQSSGGGPVFGVGVGEAEGTFTTFPEPLAPAPCPDNEAFRSGAARRLADCRAFEMVSPVDKESGDVAALGNINNRPAMLDQAAGDGDGLTYSSYRAFGDTESSPYSSQYMANREEGVGWSSEAISPTRNNSVLLPANKKTALDTQYKAFSEDLKESWLLYDSSPPLDAAAPDGFADLYRRGGTPASFEALSTVMPAHRGAQQYVPELQGYSADKQHAIFRVNEALTGDAPNLGEGSTLLYEASRGGALRFLCILPNGGAVASGCSAGTAGQKPDNRSANVAGAISGNGERVYWSASGGGLFLRIHATQPQSAIAGGKCTEAEMACTLALNAAAAQFWAANADGTKALYTVGGSLFEANLDEESTPASIHTHQIAGGVAGLLGASADAERVFLVSSLALNGAAVAGKPNLYLYEEGAFAFIATLATDDTIGGNAVPGPVAIEPFQHLARVSADGESAAFMSKAPLTGYDNSDAVSGEVDEEVFLYSAAAGKTVCVSCNPSGARPTGQQLHDGVNQQPGLWAAAQIPGWENQLYAPRALSENGRRLFFDSFEPLVLGDTNGAQDAYEWEEAGEGSCNEAANGYNPQTGGCVSLVSGGEGPEAEFLDATPDGHDAFFTTEASLLPQDPGQVDVYDARSGGGLPAPPTARAECEGEACQAPGSPLPAVTPSSAIFEGSGNVSESAKKPKSCPTGKVRSHGKCKKKKGKGKGAKKQTNKHKQRRLGR